MKRVLIFSHHHPYKVFTKDVLSLLKHASTFYNKILLFTNIPKETLSLDLENISVLESLGLKNDFLTWKSALSQFKEKELFSFDSITFMNDTCFGPLFDIQEIYLEMENRKLDFWGISTLDLLQDQSIKSIESYFIVFNQNVVHSKEFQDFWNQIETNNNFELEKKLVQTLTQANFKCDVYFKPHLDKNQTYENDFLFFHPDLAIQQGAPFLKKESVVQFPHPKYLKGLIQEYTNYDISLIDDYVSKTYPPNTSLKICDKFIVLYPEKKELSQKLRVGIHLHAYNTEAIPKILSYIIESKVKLEFIVTTGTEEKKNKILSLFEEKNCSSFLKEIIIVSDRGRDVHPWLSVFQEKNNQYDVVGHFHIKQSPFLPRWIVGSWLEEIYTPLLKYANQVIQVFQENPEVGVIVPEMPLHLQNMLGNSWGITISENQKNCNDLWKKMKLEKQIDFTQLISVVMPYGNMFWYRPRALKPLFDLNLQAEDFPEEPFPRDGAIAHAIERLPVYIAWSQNYDFRILAHNVLLQSYYEREELTKNLLNHERNLTEQRISEIYRKSLSFRVGFFLVHPWKIPNMIYRKLNKFFFQKEK